MSDYFFSFHVSVDSAACAMTCDWCAVFDTLTALADEENQ